MFIAALNLYQTLIANCLKIDALWNIIVLWYFIEGIDFFYNPYQELLSSRLTYERSETGKNAYEFGRMQNYYWLCLQGWEIVTESEENMILSGDGII